MAFADNKRPGVMVAIGVPKGPPPLESPGKKPAAAPTAAPAGAPEPDQDEQAGGSIGPEDVDYSDNDLCESCKNMGDDGSCMKYGFPVDSTGHCEAGYEPKGQAGELGSQDYGSGDMGGGQGAYGR